MKYLYYLTFLATLITCGCAKPPFEQCSKSKAFASWKVTPIKITSELNDYKWNEGLYAAMENWNNASDRHLFELGFSGIKIYWDSSLKELEQGRTSSHFSMGYFTHVEIKINPKFKDSIDPESLLIHELGHALGLRHTGNPGDTLNVMDSNLNQHQKRVFIDQGTLDVIKCLY